MDVPATDYVEVGDCDVAFQVLGDGPVDLLYFVGLGSHIDLQWESPAVARYLRRLAEFCRLVMFDRRGTGASDAIPASLDTLWEVWTADLAAVLDAVGSTQAAMCAEWDAGPIAVLYAATHPERLSSLVLGNTTARYVVADDYPIGVSPAVLEQMVTSVATGWGRPEGVHGYSPQMAADEPSIAQRVARRQRAAATPRNAAAQYRYILENLDVRTALPLLQLPTLVIHMVDNPVVPVTHGQYLADHLAQSRLLRLPGATIGLDPLSDELLDELCEFITGVRSPPHADRVLTTVLFTDIVDSTRRLAAIGDARWRSILDTHDETTRQLVRRYGGKAIRSTGDGYLASFDGPGRAIRCAQAITQAGHDLGLEIRAGIHTGECELRGDDLAGLTVHIAARIGDHAGAGDVLVSRTVVDIVAGSGMTFDAAGDHDLKGLDGTWTLYTAHMPQE